MQRRFDCQMKANAATVLLLVLLVCHALAAECGKVRGSGGRHQDFRIRGHGGAGELWVAAGLPRELPLIPINALRFLDTDDRAMRV
uniref:Uncharacterized protein n=1 Tax=Aegilops tauschii TaxID=37682 RepID=M8BWS5_AEGTA